MIYKRLKILLNSNFLKGDLKAVPKPYCQPIA